jgi:hypothetical protein
MAASSGNEDRPSPAAFDRRALEATLADALRLAEGQHDGSEDGKASQRSPGRPEPLEGRPGPSGNVQEVASRAQRPPGGGDPPRPSLTGVPGLQRPTQATGSPNASPNPQSRPPLGRTSGGSERPVGAGASGQANSKPIRPGVSEVAPGAGGAIPTRRISPAGSVSGLGPSALLGGGALVRPSGAERLRVDGFDAAEPDANPPTIALKRPASRTAGSGTQSPETPVADRLATPDQKSGPQDTLGVARHPEAGSAPEPTRARQAKLDLSSIRPWSPADDDILPASSQKRRSGGKKPSFTLRNSH